MAKSHLKLLTDQLKKLAKETHTQGDDGALVTKAEALGVLVWKYALGAIETNVKDPDKRVVIKPQQWAIQLLYDRIEGRVPMALDPGIDKITPSQKIDEMRKKSLNALAEDAAKE